VPTVTYPSGYAVHELLPDGPITTCTPEECGCSLCAPEEYGVPPGTHPGGLPIVGDYPSVWEPPHQAPSHLLLDTCVVQNLLWVRTQAPPADDDEAWRLVNQRWGSSLGAELRALVGLLHGVEAILDVEDVLCPFLVTRASWLEFSCAPGSRGHRLMDEWRLWRSRAQTFDPITLESMPHPMFTPMPEVLGWAPANQPSLPGLDDGHNTVEPLGPFRDAGDRRLIQEAQWLGVPGILTTDLKTFWRHRALLYTQGVEVWRPSDFCWALLNEWHRWRGESIYPGRPRELCTEHEAA
jgi:hypothetical protein